MSTNMCGLCGVGCFVLHLLILCINAQVDISYEITEGSSIRTFGNLARDLSLVLPDGVTYRFLSEPDIAISIASDTGDLGITAEIDRDIICPRQEQCSRSLDVAISSGDTLEMKKKIEIVIQDLNDNEPTFSPDVYVLSIPESAGVGRSFSGLPTAEDNDSPKYSIQGVGGYTLEDSTGTFILQVENEGGYMIYLVLSKPLDRETLDSFSIHIIASDAGGLSGRLTVNVEVKDSNDHAPEFKQSSYQMSVEENLPIGTTILRVLATDDDIGPNGEVVYSFRSTTLKEYGNIFGINNRTGDIFLKGTIDYETNSVYILIVIAQDKGSDSIPVDARVTLDVSDQNDCRPEIQINTLSTSNTDTAEVVEELLPRAFVAQLLVTDNDSGNNGMVTCIINDNVFELEEIEVNSEYNVITATTLDREEHDVYNLAIICTDQGDEPLTSIKQLRVQVSDVNDHRPEFKQPSYSVEIPENNDQGISLITVSAMDLDAGENSDIVYQISSDVMTQIAIDPTNGVIKAKTSFDREAEPGGKITFHVIAKDQGEPQLSSSVQVVIVLKDINDEAPYFDEPVYSFNVTEESPSSVIGTVHAVDPDSLSNNIVSYTLLDSGQSVFAVGSSSGELRTLIPLDRETEKEWTLVVSAKDSGNPPQFSTAFVTISVEDINDNAPIFTFPTEKNHTVHIPNDLQKGRQITVLEAYDQDTGINGQVTYALVGSVHSDIFSIDEMTGSIKIIADMSHTSYKEYDLAILAQDQASPAMKTFGNLKIIVNSSLSGHEATGSDILSKPNETAVIAVACVAAIVIIALAIGIACIYRHKKSLRSNKQKKFMKALTLLTTVQNQQELQSTKQNPVTGYHMHLNTAHSKTNMDNSTQRSSSVQDSGLDNSAIMNRSWTSLNAFQMQDDRDNCSAEGSNADSGCVASESGDPLSGLSTHAVRVPDPPPKPPHLGMQFDSPGRKLLYKSTSSVPRKQECCRSHHISQSFTEQRAAPQWTHSSHPVSHTAPHTGGSSLHYMSGHCSTDVYV